MNDTDVQALGDAAAAFLTALTAWHAVAEEPGAFEERPEIVAYWQTHDHLDFTLRRLGFLPPAGAGEVAELPATPGH